MRAGKGGIKNREEKEIEDPKIAVCKKASKEKKRGKVSERNRRSTDVPK
jgi:hypothetical protein